MKTKHSMPNNRRPDNFTVIFMYVQYRYILYTFLTCVYFFSYLDTLLHFSISDAYMHTVKALRMCFSCFFIFLKHFLVFCLSLSR